MSAGRTRAPPTQTPGRAVFRSELLTLGVFRCPVGHPAFARAALIDGAHLVVFPRTSVIIEQAGRRAIVTDPNVVVLYNDGQEYRRRENSPEGDYCDWFAFGGATVVEALRTYDPHVQDRVDAPFDSAHGHVQAGTYLSQRRLLNYVLGTERPDRILVEESAIGLLGRAMGDSHARAGHDERARSSPSRRHLELVEAARAQLARRFREDVGLSILARELGCSEYHLCRVFRKVTGTTLYAYRNQLRLRTALQALAESRASLIELALDLGYSSHSHFTARFGKAFGVSPSYFRGSASIARLQAMTGRLTRHET